MDDRVKKAMVRMRCDSWRWNGVKEIYEDCREDALIIEGELSRLTRENERLLSTAGGTEYARAEKAESERDAFKKQSDCNKCGGHHFNVTFCSVCAVGGEAPRIHEVAALKAERDALRAKHDELSEAFDKQTELWEKCFEERRALRATVAKTEKALRMAHDAVAVQTPVDAVDRKYIKATYLAIIEALDAAFPPEPEVVVVKEK